MIKLKDILAISGHQGLYRFLSRGRNGVIVEPLEGGKRMNAHASLKILALEDIKIFTISDELPLSEVFSLIHKKENGGEAISHKSSTEELKFYMEEVLPEYDSDRVYASDIKKIVHWYNILHSLDMLHPEEEEGSGDEEVKSEEAEGIIKESNGRKSGKPEKKSGSGSKAGEADKGKETDYGDEKGIKSDES